MLDNVKPLIVVLAISATILFLAKPIALRFMDEVDFSRRRLVWLILTVLGFLSPNIWLYALVAVPLLIWAGRKDANPIALYLFLLHVIPPVEVPIPLLGNNGLFPLNNYRMLAFCVLLPAVLRFRKSQEHAKQASFGIMDILLIALGILATALYTPPDLPGHLVIPDSATNVLRRAVLFLLDTYLLYYAVSRLTQERRKMVDALASFCVACGIMAGIAMFERARIWLLYVTIASHWNPGNLGAAYYLLRGGSVRAQVAAGHSIALGYLITIAFGFWLYLGTKVEKRIWRVGPALLLAGGLYATFSRGAWLGAGVVYFAFIFFGPRALTRVVKGMGIAAVGAGLVLISPMGDRILAMLPTSGAPADAYRHNLAVRGWELVMAHPFFGNQFPWPEMEDLRQGEGIIDIVNTYLGTALGYGFVGLVCFLGFILIGTLKAYSRSRQFSRSDPDLALVGTSICSCVAGVLVMLDSNSFNMGTEKMFFVLAGLTAAFIRINRVPAKQAAATRPVPRSAGTLLQG